MKSLASPASFHSTTPDLVTRTGTKHPSLAMQFGRTDKEETGEGTRAHPASARALELAGRLPLSVYQLRNVRITK